MKTGISILRPALDQSACKTAGTALILIKCHMINSFLLQSAIVVIYKNQAFIYCGYGLETVIVEFLARQKSVKVDLHK